MEVIKRMSKKVKEGRELVYSEDNEDKEVIGITSLLVCPLKTYYRKKYPDVYSTSLEIDEGFLFEREVKEVLNELFNNNNDIEFIEESVVKYQSKNNPKIHIEGHIDCQIIDNKNKKIINIELKAPKRTILLKDIKDIYNVDVIYDDKNDTVLVNDKYIIQAKIEKLLTELYIKENDGKYKDYEVEQYIFMKTIVFDKYNRSKKVYVIYPIYEDISIEELEKLIDRYVNDKTPRWKGECEYYCPYYNVVCDGYEYKEDNENKDIIEVEEKQLKNLIKRYYDLKDSLKEIENQIRYRVKKLPNMKVKYGNKEIGYYEVENIEIDINKLIEKAMQRKCIDKLCDEKCIIVNWRKKEKLIEEFGQDIISSKSKSIKFKI